MDHYCVQILCIFYVTYTVKYLSWKNPIESSASTNISVVSSLIPPPMRTIPFGEVHEEWRKRSWRRLLDGSQMPPEKVRQEILVRTPPHRTSSFCVCQYLSSGRFGREHQGVPLALSTSTLVALSRGAPPVIIIAEKEKNIIFGDVYNYL